MRPTGSSRVEPTGPTSTPTDRRYGWRRRPGTSSGTRTPQGAPDMTSNYGEFNRRRLLGLGLGVGAAATLGLAGCGGGSNSKSATSSGNGGKDYTGPKVDLKLWNGFTGGDGDIFKKLVDQFNGEHNNIAVSVATYQWEDYYAKLPGAVSSGNGPDIAVMHMDQLATFAARKVIQPLDDVAGALGLSEKDFAPTVWKGGI